MYCESHPSAHYEPQLPSNICLVLKFIYNTTQQELQQAGHCISAELSTLKQCVVLCLLAFTNTTLYKYNKSVNFFNVNEHLYSGYQRRLSSARREIWQVNKYVTTTGGFVTWFSWASSFRATFDVLMDVSLDTPHDVARRLMTGVCQTDSS